MGLSLVAFTTARHLIQWIARPVTAMMGDSRVIKLRRHVPPNLCCYEGRGYSFLSQPGHLPPTTTAALKICKVFPNPLAGLLITSSKRQEPDCEPDSEPFHLLLPQPFTLSSSTRSPTPHNPGPIPETVNLSAAVSRVPPQSSSNGISQSHLPPLPAPPPPPGKRSHHHPPVLKRGLPYRNAT